MKNILLLILLFLVSLTNNAQNNMTNDSIARGDIFYPNPYRNNQLTEYFDPSQIDFSEEFISLQVKNIEDNAIDVTDSIKHYRFDTSTLFCSGDYEQNGVLGANCQRIRIHIAKAERVTDDGIVFLVEGKSNVKNNICDFKGKITILSLYKFMANRIYPGQGVLFARYEFFEDKGRHHSGIFRGTFNATIKIDEKRKTVVLDERLSRGILYNNRTYVGTWIGYSDNAIRKCIWGDYRLPFTFDFDCGATAMNACEKYIDNGWETFSDGSEYDCSTEPCKLKNQWWK
ncbi:hypothetical protein D0T84_14280 [Dysgonomonas sp. 521]|uniref:hypothetical protein n=1 Tax=Dysgonomonas sp. 521 TaxID=2302932 RepID=UPI0013D0CB36|nr:hypothetical protein [Dysgonomonas sp. 521]NDV96071.1 hypothetical protein [Dysgonomonas sp. 521]